MEHESDAELAAQAINGKTEAFQKIFETHHAAMFRFAYRMARSVDVAEDITQECFVRLIKDRLFDSEQGSLRQYLYGIVRNLTRQRQYLNGREVDWSDEMEGELVSAEPLLSDSIASAEVAAAVHAGISVLPYLQREAIALRELEGLSLEETAAVLGADVGTVKSRLHRARENLRRLLAPFRNDVSGTNKQGTYYESAK